MHVHNSYPGFFFQPKIHSQVLVNIKRLLTVILEAYILPSDVLKHRYSDSYSTLRGLSSLHYKGIASCHAFVLLATDFTPTIYTP